MSSFQHGSNVQLSRAVERTDFIRTNIYWACFASAVACISMSPASAADRNIHSTTSLKSPTKALSNKPDTSCDASDALQRNLESLIRGCLVPFSAIDKLATQKDFSLVDVRSPTEYDRYHITGSINIPLHQVKTKEFLKKLSVVMVNDGRSTSELERICGELKQAGFNRVSVLEGGMFAWRANKRTLEGDPLAQVKLNRMSQIELIEEHSRPNLYVIDVSTPGKYKDIYDWLPAKIISVPLKSKGGSIARITTIISQQRKKSPKSIPLLIADNNDAYDRMEDDLKKSGIDSVVLLLDGGIQGYREHLKKQSAIWSEQNKVRSYDVCKG